MRILHLLSQNELTGAEVYAQNLIQSQHKNQHQVWVVSDKIHVSLPVEWHSLPLSVNKWSVRRNNVRQVRALLLQNKIDVIHCHSRAATRVAAAARRRLPVAMVSTIHGRQHLSWGKRLVDSYGDYKILVCDNLRYQFENELKSDPGSLRVLRNPFVIPKILSAQKKTVHKKMAFIGRSSGPKGERLKTLCTAGLFSLLEKFPEWKFDIIASNPQNFGPEFLNTISAWKNKGQIQIRSDIRDLQSEYQKYDVVIGAGRVAIEALLQGCQVLSFGEFTSHGLVNADNLTENLASNFGDMGLDTHEGPLHTSLILQNLEVLFQSPPSEIDIALVEKLQTEVAEDLVNDGVLEIYKAALFKRHVKKNIPILMYHKIPDAELETQHRIFVTKTNFQMHLDFFKQRGFTTLHFKDLSDFWNLRRPYSEFPAAPLLLTFDDGYRDNLSNALPLLEKMNMKAVLFLLSDHSIQQNTWDAGTGEPASDLLNFDERQLVSHSPLVEIGSHGLNHAKLTELDNNEVLHQLHFSKILLEMEFRRPILALAYPFGAVDNRLPKLTQLAGYEFAVNTDQGGFFFSDEPRGLFRVNIFPEENKFSLWKKTSPWYRKRFYKKHRK